jgi:hypothetical protein
MGETVIETESERLIRKGQIAGKKKERQKKWLMSVVNP